MSQHSPRRRGKPTPAEISQGQFAAILFALAVFWLFIAPICGLGT